MEILDQHGRRLPEHRQTVPETVGVTVPDGCDENKILKALLKLEHAPMPIKNSDSALLPLTPMEKGFVLGLLAAVRRDPT